ncbi:MAG: class I SAM-dependent methyltransferase [Terracidiphilus sp.]|jgi:SAM-dependent methyltransferase
MPGNVSDFYDELAGSYHLIFEDWDSAIHRQARTLDGLLTAKGDGSPQRILDCACGIGTQAIGLAMMGHQVVALDLSAAAIHRAQLEAQQRNLTIRFFVSDMTSLREIAETGFDVVMAMDNALPHLSEIQLRQAVTAIASKLKPNGLFLASIRDYDTLIRERPAIQKPAFYGASGNRRIVHQVWDWAEGAEDARYEMHLYITAQSDHEWKTSHFVSKYRCLLRPELSTVLSSAGFKDVQWLDPAESGFYQPIVLARWHE